MASTDTCERLPVKIILNRTVLEAEWNCLRWAHREDMRLRVFTELAGVAAQVLAGCFHGAEDWHDEDHTEEDAG